LGPPELIPSTITLRAYIGHPSQPEGLYHNVLIELAGKKILIDIEVIDAHLDYNILLRWSYMYAMKVVTSSFGTFQSATPLLSPPEDAPVFTIT